MPKYGLIVEMTAETLAAALRGARVCVDGYPYGVPGQLYAVNTSFERGTTEALFFHSSFPLTPDGEPFPRVRAVVRRDTYLSRDHLEPAPPLDPLQAAEANSLEREKERRRDRSLNALYERRRLLQASEAVDLMTETADAPAVVAGEIREYASDVRNVW